MLVGMKVGLGWNDVVRINLFSLGKKIGWRWFNSWWNYVHAILKGCWMKVKI